MSKPRQCKGKSRQSGKRCKRAPSPGREYCNFHGGHLKVGPDHHRFKHGLYSKFVVETTLEEKYEVMKKAGGQLLDIEEQLKVLHSLLALALEDADQVAIQRDTNDRIVRLVAMIEKVGPLSDLISKVIERHFRVLDLAKGTDLPRLDLSRLDDHELSSLESLISKATPDP